ncbi:MarR family transcriptional regulator [Salmonella enterica subsp. enterica]|nr:MarR family transcriptional regulator [Salmonella enterica subsp. enterica serovar Gombe]
MTITECVRLHPGSTLVDIIKLTGRTKSSVGGSLALLCNQGILTRETNDDGNYIYRINDMPYGCNNRLNLMFNQLLREARK